MSIGSAASLRLPQVPLSPISDARRVQGPGPEVASLPLRHLPLPVTVDDPPKGCVLIASREAADVMALQWALREAGYLAIGPLQSADEMVLLNKRLAIGQRLDCALVDLDLPEAASIAKMITDDKAPLVWLEREIGIGSCSLPLGAPVLTLPCDGTALVEAIEQARSRRSYPVPPPQPVWPRVFPSL